MNRFSSFTVIAVAVAIAGIASAEPTSGPPMQVYGGQNGGFGRALNDLELTAVTKAEMSYTKQAVDLRNAQAALLKASFTYPANPTDISGKAQAVAAAELVLAGVKADAFAKLKSDFKATPEKALAIGRALGEPAGTGAAGRGN